MPVLVTGANGEVGCALIHQLVAAGRDVVTLDIIPLRSSVAALVDQHIIGSVTDNALVGRVFKDLAIDQVIHLAALLSTHSEVAPDSAHLVNVEGTRVLLEAAQRHGELTGETVQFLYPSSIAVYGVPTRDTKLLLPPVLEDDWNVPITIYGCNKLYCEHLGRYYARHYKLLLANGPGPFVDFRCVRFPGLISAATVPAGGTSDFAPEMLHAAARGERYSCFVRPDTQIPFMTMPDAVEALMRLASVPMAQLTRTSYNLTSFSVTAERVYRAIVRAFPDAAITWCVDARRQRILDSWPSDMNDEAARRDWGFTPSQGFDAAFEEYLIPSVQERYR